MSPVEASEQLPSLYPPDFRPSDNLLVQRPCQRRAHSLPSHPQRQSIEQTPEALLRDHHPRRPHHIPIPLRHELQPGLDSIKGVSDGRRRPRRHNARHKIDASGGSSARTTSTLHARPRRAKPALSRLIEQHIEARVRRIPHSGGPKSRKEPAQALTRKNIPTGARQRAVRVQARLVPHLDDGDGHEHEAGGGAGGRARREVRRARQLRQRGRRRAAHAAGAHRPDARARQAAAQRVQPAEVQRRAGAGAQRAGHRAAPELLHWVARREYGLEGGGERARVRGVAGLLHARFEQVGWLQQDGGEEARREARGEVEGWWDALVRCETRCGGEVHFFETVEGGAALPWDIPSLAWWALGVVLILQVQNYHRIF